MNFFVGTTKIFAYFFLIFAIVPEIGGQDRSIFRIPAGTRIKLTMDSEISSRVASANDTFTTRVAEPLSIRESVVLPSGTVIEGRVISASEADWGSKDGNIKLHFERIRLAGDRHREIDASLVKELKPRSTGVLNGLIVVVSTVAGAVIGAVTRSDKGAAAGAGIGAGAGLGTVLLKKGKNVRIRTDEAFEIELKKDVTLPVTGY